MAWTKYRCVSIFWRTWQKGERVIKKNEKKEGQMYLLVLLGCRGPFIKKGKTTESGGGCKKTFKCPRRPSAYHFDMEKEDENIPRRDWNPSWRCQ